MSDTPRVLAVMLANGRAPMVERGIKSFLGQTYTEKHLLVFDNGETELQIAASLLVTVVWSPPNGKTRSIGELRNIANAMVVDVGQSDIIAHFDSDDWSSPGRLTDQVALLQASGAEAVGYSEMLFWKHQEVIDPGDDIEDEYGYGPDVEPGEAWLYSSPNPQCLLGTSLCYWASAWRKRPFPHVNTAEDHLWLLKTKKAGASAGVQNPMMIASIHGSNTSSAIQPGKREWKRAAYADSICRERMKL